MKLRQYMMRRSIRFHTGVVFLLMLLCILIVAIVSFSSTSFFMNRYHRLSSRVTASNALVPIMKETMGTEAYYIVAGRTSLEETKLLSYLDQTKAQIQELQSQSGSSQEGKRQLKMIKRTLATLERYCRKLVEQKEAAVSWQEQNVTLDQIREVSTLVGEEIDGYIYLELTHMETLEKQVYRHQKKTLISDVMIVLGALLILVIMEIWMDRGIRMPIRRLIESIGRLSEGDFNTEVETAAVNEISVLNVSFNHMVKKLDRLMHELEENTRLREQLELRLLQEQINPHFLYNTMEIIIWLAEEGDKERIIRVVKSISVFFRIVLSKGKADVTLEDELSCIESYLCILQIRYDDVLQYEIEADPSVLQNRIPKLTLQPLVENALYHGIKQKRGMGKIRVSVRELQDQLEISVEDNGIGMRKQELDQLRRILDKDILSEKGFGLSNVQKRLRLEYGKDFGLQFDSEYGRGTCVQFRIPKILSEEKAVKIMK